MRQIKIQDKEFKEDEAYPLWLIIKRIPTMDDAIAITFIMANNHKEAVKKAEEISPDGEVAYVSSLWNMFERLEFMVDTNG